MATYSNSAREVEMPDGNVVVLHSEPTGGANSTSNIKKFTYDDNGHVTGSSAADADDLNLDSYSTPTTGTTAIGTSDSVQTAIGKLDHQSQIDQTNILYALQTGAKNLFTTTAKSYSSGGLTVTVDDQNKITMSGSRSASSGISFTQDLVTGEDNYLNTRYTLPVGTYALYPESKEGFSIVIVAHNGTTQTNLGESSPNNNIFTYSAETKAQYPYIAVYIWCGSSVSFASGGETFYLMVCDKVIWDTLGHTFQPASKPNSDLTYLEAEDRAALAEEIDAGAKNKFNLAGATITTGNASYTISGNSITVTSSGTWAVAYTPITLPAGDYVLDLDVTTRTSTTNNPKITIYTDTRLMDYVGSLDIKATGHYTLPFKSTGSTLYLAWYANQSGTSSSTNTLAVANMMICTKAAFGVSPAFVPYRPNYDLVVSRTKDNVKLFEDSSNGSVATTLAILNTYRTLVGVLMNSQNADTTSTTLPSVLMGNGNRMIITSKDNSATATIQKVSGNLEYVVPSGYILFLYGIA